MAQKPNHVDLSVKRIKDKQHIEDLLKIDQTAFSKNLLNSWILVPYLHMGNVFGVYAQGSLKGFAIYLKSWDEPLVYLAELAIEKESQGKGYGYYLLFESLLQLKMGGVAKVGLTVDPNNERALRLYSERFGFKFVEFRKDEYGPGLDRLFLTLDLTEWTPKPSTSAH
ncbi:MAG: GNAT family N-acetyltransferase [Candidatus Bathyarchaeota archaeon]|nr:GNAT family N-acetyltransferase [Candidatus Bathyarchaeota archaeon]